MLKKKQFYICIVILVIVLAVVGLYIYHYKLEQQRALEEAIANITEVSKENLDIEYDEGFTNSNIALHLTTNTGYNIAYSFDNINYNNYENVINVEDNVTVYIMYVNLYGTYSNSAYPIEIKNIDRIQPKIVKKEVSTAINSLTVNIEATDNINVSKIEVSIDRENYIEVANGSYTFEGLEQGKEYVAVIKVTDVAGNVVVDEIKGITKKQEKSSNSQKKSNTKKSTSSNKSNTASSSNSKDNTSNSKTDKPQSWSTETHYGGEIQDSQGNGGYWMYGEEMDFSGIDMSDWSY